MVDLLHKLHHPVRRMFPINPLVPRTSVNPRFLPRPDTGPCSAIHATLGCELRTLTPGRASSPMTRTCFSRDCTTLSAARLAVLSHPPEVFKIMGRHAGAALLPERVAAPPPHHTWGTAGGTQCCCILGQPIAAALVGKPRSCIPNGRKTPWCARL